LRASSCLPCRNTIKPGVNGSDLLLPQRAPLRRVMANGCLGSPVLVLPRS
jgi:hypothetical protein